MAEVKAVLFSSDRPLERAENLKAVWDAYDGEKEFMQYIPGACAALCDRYSVFVVDCTPQYSPTKGDVKTIFISHGISGDKIYGLDFSESHRAGCAQVDYAICTTEYSKRLVMSQIGLPEERVLPLGFPMTDRYAGKSKGDGKTVLSAFKRAYLYAPTWRPPNNPPLPAIDWAKVDSLLEDDEMLVVKRHMCTRNTLVNRRFDRVKEYGNMLPSVPFLIDCDVLATDFSSILFDGYVLCRPSVLVADGYEGFQSAHGLYEPYPDFYGSRSVEAEGNEEAFVEMLRDACGKGLGPVEKACLAQTAGECDGHASERVADLIRSLA